MAGDGPGGGSPARTRPKRSSTCSRAAKPLSEVAAQLDVSPGQLRQWCNRARARLRQHRVDGIEEGRR
jgi:transposase-like protein